MPLPNHQYERTFKGFRLLATAETVDGAVELRLTGAEVANEETVCAWLADQIDVMCPVGKAGVWVERED